MGSFQSTLQLLTPLLEHPDYSISRDPDYFSPYLTAYHSPLNLNGMEKGVELLHTAIAEEQKIHVIGDRDVDGVSSTAVLAGFLKKELSIPDERITIRLSDDGDDYGVSGDVLLEAQTSDAGLIFFLDMGSAHGIQIDRIREGGRRVIVLDHHVLQKPPADHPHVAFINPLDSKHLMEHEGRIPTVGLVLKFLLAMAIRYTAEWNRIRLIEFNEIFFAYRLGAFLGEFPSLQEAALTLRKSHPDLEVVPHGENTPFTDAQKESMEMDPVSAGRWIFAAFVRERPRLRDFFLRNSDLVSLGMVTDMMPLVGENRMVTRVGLAGCEAEMRRGDDSRYRKGYAALIRQLKVPAEHLTSRELGWTVGPTLNAAGRMGNTRLALDLLLAENEAEALELAKQLIRLNTERKSRTAKNEEILDALLESTPSLLNFPVLFLYHTELLSGVSGILAARYAERYGRPVVYVNPDGENLRGSVRAYDGENVLQLMDLVQECFVQYGGHAGAAGFSLLKSNITLLESRIREATPIWLSQQNAQPTISGDALLEPHYHMELRPSQLSQRLMNEVHLMEPFGPGNPEPVFKLSEVKLQSIRFLSGGKHARFSIRGASSIPCLYWRYASRLGDESAALDTQWTIYGSLERSYFAGRVETRFRVDKIVSVG